MKKKLLIPLFFVIAVILCSCKKEPGAGGNSSIYGKVYVKDYNSTFTVLQDEYYGADVDVYIIYDDDKTYGDKQKTNYDGTFEFKYLHPGTYHIYAYSKDSTLQTNASVAVIQDVEITEKRQEIEAPEILIFK